ncbi:hypothetical protein JW964_17700 [candidate division KSB1 bacterium]|nr:hypothetical protein [candidate division KSB1 bacterium]
MSRMTKNISLIICGTVIVTNLMAKTNKTGQPVKGFVPAYERAVEITNDVNWETSPKVQIESAPSESIDISKTQKSENRLPNGYNRILQLISENSKLSTKNVRPMMLASLDDNLYTSSTVWDEVSVSPDKSIQINQALNINDEVARKPFTLNLEDNVTLFLGNGEQLTAAPEWLKDWNEIDFMLQNPDGTNYQFQYHQCQNGSIIFGGNQSPWYRKTYMALTHSLKNDAQDATYRNFQNDNQSTNPFKMLQSELKMHYELKTAESVSIKIYDVNQNPVRTIMEKQELAAGSHSFECWDGCDDSGKTVGDGVFFYKVLHQNEENSTQYIKFVLLR